MKKSEILNEILNDIEKYASEKNEDFGKKMKEYSQESGNGKAISPILQNYTDKFGGIKQTQMPAITTNLGHINGS